MQISEFKANLVRQGQRNPVLKRGEAGAAKRKILEILVPNIIKNFSSTLTPLDSGRLWKVRGSDPHSPP